MPLDRIFLQIGDYRQTRQRRCFFTQPPNISSFAFLRAQPITNSPTRLPTTSFPTLSPTGVPTKSVPTPDIKGRLFEIYLLAPTRDPTSPPTANTVSWSFSTITIANGVEKFKKEMESIPQYVNLTIVKNTFLGFNPLGFNPLDLKEKNSDELRIARKLHFSDSNQLMLWPGYALLV